MDYRNIVKNSSFEDPSPAAHIIVPNEGFCVKLRTPSNEKVFVNICHSEKVPLPRDISEDDLRSILEDIEGSPPFKIPMSIGEPHVELDAAGKTCTAYDVIIHSQFLKKVKSSDLFEAFLMTVIFEGLENKYNIQLERNWIVLKNRKSLGRLQEQFVRATSRPGIVEMETTAPNPRPSIIEEVQNTGSEPVQKPKGDTPKHTFLTVPNDGVPEFLIVQINLPKLRSSFGLLLDVASDMLCLQTRSQIYALQTVLHPHIDEEATVAEFNRDTKVLTVTMPVREFVSS